MAIAAEVAHGSRALGVNDLEGLVNVQFAPAAPIAHAVGSIAERPHLHGEDARAERVHDAGGYEHEAPFAHSDTLSKTLPDAVVGGRRA